MSESAPRYKHDCESCTFLGRHGDADLYFADHGGATLGYIPSNATVISRWGDEPSNYSSGLIAAENEPDLAAARDLAIARGLLRRVDNGQSSNDVKGYHIRPIPKGKLGELSKVLEELDEATDAEGQNNPVMVLLELSDLLGAVDAYLQAKFNGHITMTDLMTMASATKRAFDSGERT